MKDRDVNTDARIRQFLDGKVRKYPELAAMQRRKIPVFKRGELFDEIYLFLSQRGIRGGM